MNERWRRAKAVQQAEGVVHFEYTNGNAALESRWVRTWHDKIAPAESVTEAEAAKFYEILRGYMERDKIAVEATPRGDGPLAPAAGLSDAKK